MTEYGCVQFIIITHTSIQICHVSWLTTKGFSVSIFQLFSFVIGY